MSKEDRDRLRAEAGQFETELNRIWSELGMDAESGRNDSPALKGEMSRIENLFEDPVSGNDKGENPDEENEVGNPFDTQFAPGKKDREKTPSAGFARRVSRRTGLAFYGKPSPAEDRREASSLIIEETDEPFTEEDLHYYRLRKKYFDIPGDNELELKERQLPGQISAWKDENPAGLPLNRLYMQIGAHLQNGQVSDSAQQEMIMLSGTQADFDPGMKQFYSAFTLLQSNPSGEQIAAVMARIGRIPSSSVEAEGIRILSRAIKSAAEKQAAINAEKDRKSRARQAEYDRRKEQAQNKYDTAKRSADRWRK